MPEMGEEEAVATAKARPLAPTRTPLKRRDNRIGGTRIRGYGMLEGVSEGV